MLMPVCDWAVDVCTERFIIIIFLSGIIQCWKQLQTLAKTLAWNFGRTSFQPWEIHEVGTHSQSFALSEIRPFAIRQKPSLNKEARLATLLHMTTSGAMWWPWPPLVTLSSPSHQEKYFEICIFCSASQLDNIYYCTVLVKSGSCPGCLRSWSYFLMRMWVTG